jgi:hypothetical protein
MSGFHYYEYLYQIGEAADMNNENEIVTSV